MDFPVFRGINLQVIRAALLFGLATLLLGLLLRLASLVSIAGNWMNWLHAHSHIGFLGFFYLLIMGAVAALILDKQALEKPAFRWNFILTVFSLLGMLFSFPLQGYGLYSILFCTLHVACAYHFLSYSLRHSSFLATHPALSMVWIAAVFFMAIAMLAPLSLGFILSRFGATSPMYPATIYFYLHFLYNGFISCFVLWFLLFRFHKSGKEELGTQVAIWLFLAGVLFSLPLSFTFAYPYPIYFSTGGLGALLQLTSFLYLLLRCLHVQGMIWQWICHVWVLKLSLQLACAFPPIANWVNHSRPLVICYLHGLFLGIFLPAFVGILQYLFPRVMLSAQRFGFYVFFLVATEFWLFCQALPTKAHWMLVLKQSFWGPCLYVSLILSLLMWLSPVLGHIFRPSSRYLMNKEGSLKHR